METASTVLFLLFIFFWGGEAEKQHITARFPGTSLQIFPVGYGNFSSWHIGTNCLASHGNNTESERNEEETSGGVSVIPFSANPHSVGSSVGFFSLRAALLQEVWLWDQGLHRAGGSPLHLGWCPQAALPAPSLWAPWDSGKYFIQMAGASVAANRSSEVSFVTVTPPGWQPRWNHKRVVRG